MSPGSYIGTYAGRPVSRDEYFYQHYGMSEHEYRYYLETRRGSYSDSVVGIPRNYERELDYAEYQAIRERQRLMNSTIWPPSLSKSMPMSPKSKSHFKQEYIDRMKNYRKPSIFERLWSYINIRNK